MAVAKILDPTEVHIDLVSKQLASGDVVGIPTETVYGLAANGMIDQSVLRIYSVKKRPPLNPLIAHYATINEMSNDVVITPLALKLAQAFWPGPLTMVLNQTDNTRISRHATAGLNTLAVRMPAHPIAHQLLKKCPFPVVAPSANPSGKLSPIKAHHVQKGLGTEISFILDGGEAEKGLESTIIDLTSEQPIILRPGSVTPEMLALVLDEECLIHTPNKTEVPKAPGMRYPHYAPLSPLRLTIENPQKKEALLTFGSQKIPDGYAYVLNLSPCGDLNEAAANLFKFLHIFDEIMPSRISVMPIPNTGVGIAINEKLRKAADTTNS